MYVNSLENKSGLAPAKTELPKRISKADLELTHLRVVLYLRTHLDHQVLLVFFTSRGVASSSLLIAQCSAVSKLAVTGSIIGSINTG